MLNLNEHQLHRLTEAHREDLLRQAQQRRLANAAQSNSRSAREAALSRLGSALVALGMRLQSAGKREPLQQTAYR